MNEPVPRVSVIIPVYNCASTIGKCLDSLALVEHPSFEVLIMDDGSTDGTAEICESRQWAKVTKLGRGGPSRARNRGIELARGDFVAFTDGDCVVDRNWLNELERSFVSDDVAGVGGDQISPADEARFGRTVQEFFKAIGFMTGYIRNDRALVEVEHNPSCNSMYRKSVLKELGGFDETLFPGEDVDLDYRMIRRGYKLIYNPFAVVGHYRPGTCKAFVSMMKRYGASQRRLVKKYGFFRRILFVPPLCVAALCCMIIVLWQEPAIWPAVVAPLPLVWFWFGTKARSAGMGLIFTLFLVITLVSWNWGFFGRRTQKRERRSILSRLFYKPGPVFARHPGESRGPGKTANTGFRRTPE